MWNHLVRFNGPAYEAKYRNLTVDANGRATLATEGNSVQEYPFWDNSKTSAETYWRIKLIYTGPARRAGEALLIVDPLDMGTKERRAWSYLPGQRRVKVAPDFSHDTPNPGTAGANTFDDIFIFNGSMDRFDFKLVGKKEMYRSLQRLHRRLPVEAGRPAEAQSPEPGPGPLGTAPRVGGRGDAARRQAPRVQQARVLPRRGFVGGARVRRVRRTRPAVPHRPSPTWRPSYDLPAPYTDMFSHYDLVARSYALTGFIAETGGLRHTKPLPDREWTADSLAGTGRPLKRHRGSATREPRERLFSFLQPRGDLVPFLGARRTRCPRAAAAAPRRMGVSRRHSASECAALQRCSDRSSAIHPHHDSRIAVMFKTALAVAARAILASAAWRRRADAVRGATCSTRQPRRARSRTRSCSTDWRARATRLVAVGQRGHVLYSDDPARAGSRPRCRSAPIWWPWPSRPRQQAGPSATTASCCTAPMPAPPGRASSTVAPPGTVLVDYYTRAAASAAAATPSAPSALLEEAKRFAAQGAENPLARRLVRERIDRLRRRRLRPDPADDRWRRQLGAAAARHRQPARRCTSTRCAASAPRSTSPASKDCC